MSDSGDRRGEENQRLLSAELGRLRALLEAKAAGGAAPRLEVSSPPALEAVRHAFGLSAFERDLLLLCAGMELDGAFAAACEKAGGPPSFGLALALLADPHWSALAPTAPLRSWGLLELAAGELLTRSPLRIEETVLHFLAGLPCLDRRLEAVLEPVPAGAPPVPSGRVAGERLAAAWLRAQDAPLVHLGGRDPAARRAAAAPAAPVRSGGRRCRARPLAPARRRSARPRRGAGDAGPSLGAAGAAWRGCPAGRVRRARQRGGGAPGTGVCRAGLGAAGALRPQRSARFGPAAAAVGRSAR